MKNRFITGLLVGLFLITSAATADAVMVDGEDWRQVTDTFGLSYNQLASIYDTTTGQLQGGLATTEWWGIEFDGWVWASEQDVADLISSYTGYAIPLNTYNNENSSTWAPAFIADFDAVSPGQLGGLDTYAVWGATRDLVLTGLSQGLVQTGLVQDTVDDGEDVNFVDHAGVAVGDVHAMRGAWLYRPAPVPEPSTLLLLGSGLAGLALLRRRLEK